MTRFLVLLSLVLLPFAAKSQVFTPTIAGAMGGAGRAAIDGGESALLNPASIAHMREYYFGAHYQRGEHPHEGDYSRYAIQLTDGTSDLVPGGASIYRQKIDLPNGAGSRTDQDIQIGVAGFVIPGFALGVSGHYFTQSGQGRDNAQWNGTMGVIFSPNDHLGIGLVGYDIAPISTDALMDRKLIPTLALGVHYVLSDLLRLRLDLVRPDIQPLYANHRINAMGGLESFFATTFVFRLGAQALETADQMNLTTGFGYHGPRLSVDYSFQKDIRSAGGVRHLIDLWLPL
jgi:hypothetical protein